MAARCIKKGCAHGASPGFKTCEKCRTSARLWADKYRHEHKEEWLTKVREYRNKNREALNKKAAEWRAQNKDKVKIINRKFKHHRAAYKAKSLSERLRKRVREAFRFYSTTGKLRSSKELGIDYKAIIAHIGACPGLLREWEIDHIVPLCSFNLDDPEQIKIAFSATNHQWLRCEENRKKGAKGRIQWPQHQ